MILMSILNCQIYYNYYNAWLVNLTHFKLFDIFFILNNMFELFIYINIIFDLVFIFFITLIEIRNFCSYFLSLGQFCIFFTKIISEIKVKYIKININYNEKYIFWWEPWSYEVIPYFPPFSKKFVNSPWHFFYKFRLSTWLRWHILEDRICIFVIFFLWFLI